MHLAVHTNYFKLNSRLFPVRTYWLIITLENPLYCSTAYWRMFQHWGAFLLWNALCSCEKQATKKIHVFGKTEVLLLSQGISLKTIVLCFLWKSLKEIFLAWDLKAVTNWSTKVKAFKKKCKFLPEWVLLVIKKKSQYKLFAERFLRIKWMDSKSNNIVYYFQFLLNWLLPIIDLY